MQYATPAASARPTSSRAPADAAAGANAAKTPGADHRAEPDDDGVERPEPTGERLSKRFGDPPGRVRELLVRDVGEDVLPERKHHPRRLEHPERPRNEPHVEVRAAVAPAVEVHAADVAEAENRALDTGGQRAERGGRLRREVAERVDVLATRQPDRSGEAASDGRVQAEVLVLPDGRGRLSGAEAAGLAAFLSAARRLGDDSLAPARGRSVARHTEVAWSGSFL